MMRKNLLGRSGFHVSEIAFGGGCINDVVMHIGNPRLPFGGVGESGMGSYHGEAGFRAGAVLPSYGLAEATLGGTYDERSGTLYKTPATLNLDLPQVARDRPSRMKLPHSLDSLRHPCPAYRLAVVRLTCN